MKSAALRITPASEEKTALAVLGRKTQGVEKPDAENSLLLQQAEACVREFVRQARQQHASGTAIQMKKDFRFSNLKLSMYLDVSRRQGFMERLTSSLRRK